MFYLSHSLQKVFRNSTVLYLLNNKKGKNQKTEAA